MTRTKKITLIALFSAIISICSLLQISATVPFTMQTFGVFLSLLCLGGFSGTASIVVYILLGIIGVPVFAGFRSGFGVIASQTGGYILGFVAVGIVYILFERTNKTYMKVIGLVVGLALLYAVGTLWFVFVAKGNDGVSFGTAFVTCVAPFIIPDLLKLVMATAIADKLKRTKAFTLKR